jgi:hypothetical protein
MYSVVQSSLASGVRPQVPAIISRPPVRSRSDIAYTIPQIISLPGLSAPAPSLAMDPSLVDAIPDDHGDVIRDLIRDRDGSDSEERPRKRARTDTGALLPQEQNGQKTEESSQPGR